MHDGYASGFDLRQVPSWVPEAARHYLAHTETGMPIRVLARRAGRHASTVLRQIRACETRRDDLLVDEALRRLGQRVHTERVTGSAAREISMTMQSECSIEEGLALTNARLISEARRVLRRMCEGGAFLAVSVEMEKAVVVRDGAHGLPMRTAVVDREIAEALALKGWIASNRPGRIARYHITAAGREALNGVLVPAEGAAAGPYRAGTGPDEEEAAHPEQRSARALRYGPTESPLVALARRRDKTGERFLGSDLVRVGERLREDFELAQMGPRVTQNWDRFLCAVDEQGAPPCGGTGVEAARARVIGALRDLGPGLGDVVLRCCCYLEGLEQAERRMGWSARSGKIVLRIALQRLKRHYEMLGEAGQMIG
jgi:hypothetical protein